MKNQGSFCLGENAEGSLHPAAHWLRNANVGSPRADCAPCLSRGPGFPTPKLCGRNREVVWPPLSQLLRNKEAAAAAYIWLAPDQPESDLKILVFKALRT